MTGDFDLTGIDWEPIGNMNDMQNHVLPYLQSFCSLEEKGVKERREQQVAEKNESREAVPRTGGEANIAVKDAGKAERKEITGKEKKPSIHERLEINKRIIQEKQGKDKPEVADNMVTSGFFCVSSYCERKVTNFNV